LIFNDLITNVYMH